MLKRIVFVGLVATASLGAAQAQDEPRDGFYVRAGAGANFLSDLEQEFTNESTNIFAIAAGQTVATDTGFVAGAAVGFDYADGIRTELEYRFASAKVVSVSPIGLFPAPDGESVTANILMSNFYYDFQNSSRLTPFVGLGVGGAFVENENSERDAALAYQGRVGLSFDFGDSFDIDVEYIYLRTNDLVFSRFRTGTMPPSTEVVTESHGIDGAPYVSSSVMVSLRKQF